MIESVTRSADGKTFTLSIGGEQRIYGNDKEGKRQAILDGLGAIATLTVGDDVYLPHNDALQVVAAVLYPDGIQTESAYQTVCQVAAKACAHIGYGEEVELGPPRVPFAARGSYRKRYPPVDAEKVLAELELAGTNSYQPRQELAGRIIWNKAGLSVYGRSWYQLTPEQQQQIQTQVEATATQAGWTAETAGQDVLYSKPLPVEVEQAKSRLTGYLRGYNGRPIPVRTVSTQAQLGAYGRAFYTDDLVSELATVVAQVLRAIGYQTEPTDEEYRPVVVAIPAAAEPPIRAALAALETVATDLGPALLLDDLLVTVRAVAGVETISEWQAEQLVQSGPVSQMLRQLGYQTELTWCQPLRQAQGKPYHFRTPLSDGDDRERQVILKEVRVQHDPHKKLSLAQGLAVYTPALALDDEDDTLVYLEMVGPKQSVKANWAALMGGGKVHWLGTKRLQLSGMKQHVKIQATLPCGWTNYILIHKQASLKEMNPEQPFYLLDDGTQPARSPLRGPIPPLFYPMLNKCLALPLLASWSEYLWENGRERNLITLLDKGEGQGYAAWRVLPALAEWQNIVESGLHSQMIAF
jgi:hypothetical protein